MFSFSETLCIVVKFCPRTKVLRSSALKDLYLKCENVELVVIFVLLKVRGCGAVIKLAKLLFFESENFFGDRFPSITSSSLRKVELNLDLNRGYF